MSAAAERLRIELLLESRNELLAALKSAVGIASEAAREWDMAPNGMKAGKLLLALCGHVKGYRRDIDAIHEAIARAERSKAEGKAP